MKIINILAKYRNVDELSGVSNPIFYLKPDSTLLLKNRDFYIPDFITELQAGTAIVVKINRLGKNIAERFAHKYYEELALGISFTALNLLDANQPWALATSFDGSTVLGNFLHKKEFDLFPFSFQINDKEIPTSGMGSMSFTIDQTIAYISQFMTLKIGDLIYMEIPCETIHVHREDKLSGLLKNKELFHCKIK